jgi:hypothetical protein
MCSWQVVKHCTTNTMIICFKLIKLLNFKTREFLSNDPVLRMTLPTADVKWHQNDRMIQNDY